MVQILFGFHIGSVSPTSTDLSRFYVNRSIPFSLASLPSPHANPMDSIFTISLHRRHQSDGNEMAHTRLRASTRDLRASPKPTSKSTIEEDLKKLIDLESPTPESQKNFKVE